MLARQSPHEAYARVDFDARVAGADPRELVTLCYERLACDLGTALHAQARGDNALKSRSLTRALAAITALQLGVSGSGDVAMALRQLYASARRTILDSAVDFQGTKLEAIRRDFVEIRQAVQAA